MCQAERAPGSKVTHPAVTREGSGAWMSGSIRTVPVKYSSGPFWEGRDPFRLISMSNSFEGSGSDCFMLMGENGFPGRALHNVVSAIGLSQPLRSLSNSKVLPDSVFE